MLSPNGEQLAHKGGLRDPDSETVSFEIMLGRWLDLGPNAFAFAGLSKGFVMQTISGYGEANHDHGCGFAIRAGFGWLPGGGVFLLRPYARYQTVSAGAIAAFAIVALSIGPSP